jgi:peptidoglycan/xylan/chitin deacetylase (PgdA/CDA1 family)
VIELRRETINLTFHGIGAPERPLDPGEDQVWLDPDQFAAALDSVVGRTNIRLTFDDGNASDLEYALEGLRRRGLTATFFVVAGRLGDRGFLDESGVRSLVGAGMGIGCHGMRHRPWQQLDEHGLKEELSDARGLLEEVAGQPITEASCPFGSYDRRVLRTLRRHGYRRAYTSDEGATRPSAWLQARNTVTPENARGLVDRIVARERPSTGLLKRRARSAAKRWR